MELGDAERTLKSREVGARLKGLLDWSKAESVHYFEPLRELMEPDISPFITWLEDEYPKLKLFTPRRIEGKWELVAVRGGQPPAAPRFDVVVVPALGFDPRTLHRIGYGGGYYDKFLATQPQAKKIGVCFEAGKLEQSPIEPHDVRLDLVITEAKAYSLKTRRLG